MIKFMELKDLRKELKLPVSVLKNTIDRTTNSQKSWVNTLDTSIEEYAKKLKNRTLNYLTFGSCISDNGVCVIGFNSETNGKFAALTLAKMAEKIAIEVLKNQKQIKPMELLQTFAYVQDDLIAQLGENILLSYVYLDSKNGISPLNTSYYSPNNHIGCVATLEGGDNLDVSKIAKIVAQNAVCYYGDFWETYKSIRKMCSDITDENFKKYLPDFVSYLLKQPLFFSDEGIACDLWGRKKSQISIKDFLDQKSEALGTNNNLVLQNVKICCSL
ncbi:MAG: hypothetical protein IKW58_02320 [Alphaproteobacteria bacterium]|nr:hypothetical protein [Alphaproteobacteria bacterium]